MDKIKVDLLCLFQENTGQTVYFKELSRELKKIKWLDLKIINPNESRIFSFLNHYSNSLALKSLPFLLGKKIRNDSIIHITNQELFFLLQSIKNKSIVTLHDLSLFSYYKIWKEKDVKLLNKTEKIICISNSTKKELDEKFPVLAQKVVVVYCGLKSNLKKSNSNIREKYGLNEKDRIILFIGSDDEKKNFFTLLKAFSELKQENLILVKVGSPWTMHESQRKKFESFISEHWLEEKVKILDSVSNQDLTDFYFEAEIFVCPSHYEGFGLTLIEAMACGCPVVSADNTSLPEIAGNAALFFNSENENQLLEQLNKILNDENLKKDLIQKGFQNIKRFNWKKSAKKLAEIYKGINK
ncbi:glycosyltransferase family 4 protein [Candidatus Micrarchaeota archaeon]|nr:glycosyltransferase family 4 protein [Candidatus Micrarchaeota archaeon]MBU2476195.1 glycosyltransferase family 4 protein [Candidatus Micrarchaeota archaeon]